MFPWKKDLTKAFWRGHIQNTCGFNKKIEIPTLQFQIEDTAPRNSLKKASELSLFEVFIVEG